MKKLITAALVLVMILSLAIPALATDINFTGGAAGAEYSAYKILNATDGGGGLIAYTLNAKYTAILQTITGKTLEADIVEYISNLNEAETREFADAVYAAIKAGSIAADYTTTTDKITGAEEGYYLIAETKLGTPSTDTRSLAMLDTVGKSEVTIITKESYPTIDKEVYEINDSTGVGHWGEHADYDVGDEISYRINATVSGQYEHYVHYWYQITDEMSEGLTLNKDTIKITIGGVDVTSHFTITKEDHKFVAEANLKAVDAAVSELTISHLSTVVVTYTCTLNENAKSGVPGNPNVVQLKFQNDPYINEKPTDPGETPKDTNIVFTYDSIVNKIDGSGNALAGAGFTLFKWDSAANAWNAVGSEITGVTTFEYRGLDAGTYKLVETTVPAGYNKAADIEFHVVATYDTTKNPVELIDLKVTDLDNDVISSFVIDLDDGEAMTNIVNNAGSELPSTGGIGTTIFYILGSIMVVGAAVILVTKKRMAV